MLKQEALRKDLQSCRDTRFVLAAIDILERWMPKSFYTSHFQRMSGEVSIEQLQKDKEAKKVSPGDQISLDFLEYSGTSLEKLHQTSKREELKARCEAAGNDITEEIFQFWSQNTALEIVIDFDSGEPGDPPPFNTGTIAQVRIRNTNHKATLPLSERSAGIRSAARSDAALDSLRISFVSETNLWCDPMAIGIELTGGRFNCPTRGAAFAACPFPSKNRPCPPPQERVEPERQPRAGPIEQAFFRKAVRDPNYAGGGSQTGLCFEPHRERARRFHRRPSPRPARSIRLLAREPPARARTRCRGAQRLGSSNGDAMSRCLREAMMPARSQVSGSANAAKRP
jgi:hypothetical protein